MSFLILQAVDFFRQIVNSQVYWIMVGNFVEPSFYARHQKGLNCERIRNTMVNICIFAPDRLHSYNLRFNNGKICLWLAERFENPVMRKCFSDFCQVHKSEARTDTTIFFCSMFNPEEKKK